MKILVTGGFGYIGGRLIDYLKRECPENEIVLAERPLHNIPVWAERITYLPLELLSEESVSGCIAAAQPECIVHLAALNEKDCSDDPLLADKVNRLGTEHLAKSALKYNVKHFIYFSTFHVYGKAARGLITEQTIPEPVHPYAVTHLNAEEVVARMHDKGLKTTVFRVSNGYGYPMDKSIGRWSLLVNDLCRQAVTTGRMALISSGRQKRDFISMSDIARAVKYFIFDVNNGQESGLYNLGSGNTISVLDMAHKISGIYRKKYAKKAEIVPGTKEPGVKSNSMDFEYSIESIKKVGFTLKGNMDYEISKTMDVCEELK